MGGFTMDHIVTYRKNEDPLIPAYVSVNGFETPVWNQSRWTEGPYARYVQRNGCGHCCAGMAARLHGVEIDPGMEFDTCVMLWDEPDEHHGWFQTVRGIASILSSYGITASAFGVPEDPEELSYTGNLMESALACGHQVIFWSHPYYEDNPFSKGEHYVMAAGYDDKGHIVIANSGAGIQLVSMDDILKAVYRGSTASVTGWGIVNEKEDFRDCSGIVIV